jgi:hypothetical protein
MTKNAVPSPIFPQISIIVVKVLFILLWFFRFLKSTSVPFKKPKMDFEAYLILRPLCTIINITQDSLHTLMITHIQRQKLDHPKILDQPHNRLTQPRKPPLPTRTPLRGSRIKNTRIPPQKLFQSSPRDLPLHQIDLTQDIQVRAFKHDHSGHGAQGAGEEFLGLQDELRFQEVCCAEGEAEVCAQVGEQGREDVRMVGV